jgi:hypothetical protein
MVDYGNKNSHRGSIESLSSQVASRPKTQQNMRSSNNNIDVNQLLHSIMEMQPNKRQPSPFVTPNIPYFI